MRIYTKFGDKGLTRLYGGERVSKSHERVEAYGTVDELCSLLGRIVAEMREHPILDDVRLECEEIQQQLFDCGSDLATPGELRPYKQQESDALWLESRIDAYVALPPKLEKFIIPGGHLIASSLHLARTITRRLERRIVSLMEVEEKVNPIGLIYINRLSDYFFVLARLVNFRMGDQDTVYEKSPKIFRERKQVR